VQEGDGPLGMCGGLNDGPPVVLEHLNPATDISGMIGAGVDGNAKIGGKERRAKLGDQFLAGITFIAPCLAPERAVKAGFVASPVNIMPISA